MDRLKTSWINTFSGAKANLALRCVLMLLGVILIGCGIALAKHSCTGTSPISSLPAVLTEITSRFGAGWMTMGMWTFVFNMIYFLSEVVLLRREFKAIQLLQIPLVFVLSAAVDLWLGLFSLIELTSYALQLLLLAISIVTLALGIKLQLESDLLLTPGDAIVQVISYVSRRPFPKCKVAWDVSLMCSAALMSLIVLGGLYQVREGTIISSLLVGTVVGIWARILKPLKWMVPESQALSGIVLPGNEAR